MPLSSSSLLLALAIRLPSHGRVNLKCYTAWNDAKTNLDVMWNGARYSQPWTFSKEVNTNACTDDNCVQRLWCADSGVAGRYVIDRTQSTWAQNNKLSYAWLLDTSLQGTRALAVQGREDGDSTVMQHTTENSRGTLLVMGSTLFFYTYDQSDSNKRYGLPRLTSLVFAEYRSGVAADSLVTTQLNAFNVLGYANYWYRWKSEWSPIYPAGPSALTISIQDRMNGDNWALDVSLTVSGSTATRKAIVHLPYGDIPSIRSTSREVLTVPGFTCRAFTNSSAPKCYRIGESAAQYTWASSSQNVLNQNFAPMSGLASFSLPSTLWLYDVNPGNGKYRVISACGLGSIIAFNQSDFYGVETRSQSSCASGKELFLVSYDISGAALVEKTVSASLGCFVTQHFPGCQIFEVPYEATHVKWLGPFAPEYPFFVAADIADREYNETGVGCSGGTYPSMGACASCPAGYACDGQAKTPCAAGTHAGAGATTCAPCSAGTFSGAAASSCTPCDAGTYQPDAGQSACLPCPGGFSCSAAASAPCSAGTFSPQGSAVCSNCSAGSYSGAAASTCASCGRGTYTAATGSSTCSPCASGSFTSLTNSADSSAATSGALYCIACPAGHSCDGAAKTPCTAGHYAGGGAQSCGQCGAGTFAEAGAANCTECPAGTASSQLAAPSSLSCRACPSGKYQPSAGQDTCLDCPAGFSCTTTAKSQCGAGFYSPQGSSACTSCGDGSFASSPGSARCEPCSGATQYTDGGHTTCMTCSSGSVASADHLSCTTCGAGQISENGDCVACPPGTAALIGASTCTACAPGSFSHGSAERCALCPAGTYSGVSGADSSDVCRPCPAGTFSAAGSGECSPCAPGSFSIGEGNALCAACSPGFTSSSGAIACELCPAGYVCPGGTSPLACDMDLGEGAAECVLCPSEGVWVGGNCVDYASASAGLSCEERSAGGAHYVACKTPNNGRPGSAAPSRDTDVPLLSVLLGIVVLSVAAIVVFVALSLTGRKRVHVGRGSELARVAIPQAAPGKSVLSGDEHPAEHPDAEPELLDVVP